MRLNNIPQNLGNVALISGKLALRVFKIGLTRIAIQSLQESEREASRDITGQIERGYTERVAPELRNQIRKFNIIKGNKA